MLWVKTFHIFFVVAWFAGLFYLPRIFVNLAIIFSDKNIHQDNKRDEYDRLIVMGRKLYKFIHPIMILSIIFGVWLWIGYEIGFEREFNWMHIKLSIVILLITYHLYCGKILRDFTNFKCKNSHVWFRIFNEIPVFLLFFTIYLVIFKPL